MNLLCRPLSRIEVRKEDKERCELFYSSFRCTPWRASLEGNISRLKVADLSPGWGCVRAFVVILGKFINLSKPQFSHL